MDSTLLQLFSAEEIFGRLTEKGSTGGLHIFTTKESANVFFREGKIVGASKGLMEGEDVVKQILEWKEARFIWQPNLPPFSQKEVEIYFPDFLLKLKAAPKLEIAGKTVTGKAAAPEAPKAAAPAPTKTPAAPEVPPLYINIPSRAASTGPVQRSARDEGTARPAQENPPSPRSFTSLTATKNINPAPQARTEQEEILLNKFPLVLVATDEESPLRLKMVRLSSLVGRNPACELTVDHSSVSRQHCLLQITERGLQVKDLDSTNGTKVNGIVLREEGYISVGDKLTIGHVDFILEEERVGG